MEVHDLRSMRQPVPTAAPARATVAEEPEGRHYIYEEDEIMRPGRIVAHPTFGRGKILKAEGHGESLRLEIMFTGLGVKKIMAKFARLKIVG
jgi:DNA helicase-2/ATP-dependent DNA helicase PcrA